MWEILLNLTLIMNNLVITYSLIQLEKKKIKVMNMKKSIVNERMSWKTGPLNMTDFTHITMWISAFQTYGHDPIKV